MTQEDKDLLLKDLCARLPYGIKAALGNDESNPNPYTIYGITPSGTMQAVIAAKAKDGIPIYTDNILGFKPYLRPMSSMTEDEKKDYYKLLREYDVSSFVSRLAAKVFDWLNSHHFDYRGLIEKGLALEAPEGMYNF